ncbi:MAG: peptidase [Candidatus Kapaibacteriota bacterium]
MKPQFLVACAALLLCFGTNILLGQKAAKTKPGAVSKPALTHTLVYEVNLNDRSDDTFKVRLLVSGLTAANAVYQFAATAPGTYQIMDVGRFVRKFQAFDEKGKEIPCENISVNQWKIKQPEKVVEIRYAIAETFDTPVTRDEIFRMCGSSIEDDHTLFNVHTVIGFPTEMQSTPLKIKFLYPSAWKIGTPLEQDSTGFYYAKNYDFAVDSPVLMGRLTSARTNIKGTAIEIYTYSKTDQISSEQLLGAMSKMLNSAGEFLRELPVKRYTFLFHFENTSAGAWEHSYSSEYVMEERPFTPEYGQSITDIAAHEFFHVITPLNIHSEIIERFNFVKPTASEHLWLYEGTTEWAAHIMQLRSGLKSLDQYLADLSQKTLVDQNYFDRTYSLSKLSLTCYSDSGQKQYGNIYYRGALVAGMLDIRLLELSNGKRGLREVIQELMKKYGPEKAFSEKEFLQEFVKMTYPEIADFFEQYVRKANPLPLREYYAKIGIAYSERKFSDTAVAEAGLKTRLRDGKLTVADFRETLVGSGVEVDDEIRAVNGKPLTNPDNKTFANLTAKFLPSTTYTLTVLRSGKELTLTLPVQTRREERQYVFERSPQAYYRQIMLRNAWLKNL